MNSEQKSYETLFNLWNILTIAKRKEKLQNEIEGFQDKLTDARGTAQINAINNELSMKLKNWAELEKYHTQSIGIIEEIKELLK